MLKHTRLAGKCLCAAGRSQDKQTVCAAGRAGMPDQARMRACLLLSTAMSAVTRCAFARSCSMCTK